MQAQQQKWQGAATVNVAARNLTLLRAKSRKLLAALTGLSLLLGLACFFLCWVIALRRSVARAVRKRKMVHQGSLASIVQQQSLADMSVFAEHGLHHLHHDKSHDRLHNTSGFMGRKSRAFGSVAGAGACVGRGSDCLTRGRARGRAARARSGPCGPGTVARQPAKSKHAFR